jgi:hypothetical protein
MNLPPSHRFRTDLHRSFVIVRENFQPETNLVVEWEK